MNQRRVGVRTRAPMRPAQPRGKGDAPGELDASGTLLSRAPFLLVFRSAAPDAIDTGGSAELRPGLSALRIDRSQATGRVEAAGLHGGAGVVAALVEQQQGNAHPEGDRAAEPQHVGGDSPFRGAVPHILQARVTLLAIAFFH